MDLAKQYQRKTDKQHVLDNPDTYIGSVEKVDAEMWIYDGEKIVQKTIEYIPGLFKLMDEGIVNCRDHVLRMNQSTAENKKIVTLIDVQIEDGKITFMNDGNGVDVAQHPEENIWIPELVFGHLRTSTNYDTSEKKIVGGKNGFGFKLVLIWSTWGRIETVDHIRGLKYTQEFHNNLTTIDPPVITKVSTTKPYTKVSFIPDYKRLQVKGLSDDMISLMRKRVYDIAAVTDHSTKKIKVTYNGETLSLKSFAPYVDLYIGSKDVSKRVYEAHERWEYVVGLAPNQFHQVSFVNGVCTFKGGKHVDYILGQILRKLCVYIEKKKKIVVNQNSIKEQIMLFLRCDIENPSFDSQTKDFLTTPSSKFGSQCIVSDAFIEKIAKMGVMDMACQLTETKEAGKTKKKMDGTKTKTVRGIANFVDANYAGTDKSKQCTLILAEGLSAMSGIVSGLKSEDRNVIGIYPLKGKVLNVRGSTKDIRDNKELADLIKILGLEIGREYTAGDVQKCLRYSKVMIMADQDLDGSHIKGLCINLFHAMWPSLVRLEGFLSFMNTPILRATKGKQTLRFYNEGEHQKWKTKDEKGWTLKYFKGLGTSTSTEFKEYFANPKMVNFRHSPQSDDSVDMVFNKKRAEDRKVWLENYNKDVYLDTTNPVVNYETFFSDEMVHFSVYDCARSIPNMVDGLKTSLRKILYSAFKRNLTKEIKVAQFSGFVSENSAYHHGEASLNGAIVHMAQNFVGSNNINLLVPNGQFGTRLKGGEDSASERYIFTCLSPITRCIFPEADDKILTYLEDDGQCVEPLFYVPIIPFALVNGLAGIGTGFSCNIPSYSPLQLIDCIRQKIAGSTELFLKNPYYEGFSGTVLAEEGKYVIKGKYEKVGEDSILVTELPIGTWTMNYLTFLEDGLENKKLPIRDFVNMSTEVTIHITIHFVKGKLAELEANGLEKLLHLVSSATTSNMNLFNANVQLHKYKTVQELIDAYYEVRLSFYSKRKAAEIVIMQNTLIELTNRAKFIQDVISGAIDLRAMANDEDTDTMLQRRGYKTVNDAYHYLTRMPMQSMNKLRAQKIMEEKIKLDTELDILKQTAPTDMWLTELILLEKEYGKYKQEREKLVQVVKAKR